MNCARKLDYSFFSFSVMSHIICPGSSLHIFSPSFIFLFFIAWHSSPCHLFSLHSLLFFCLSLSSFVIWNPERSLAKFGSLIIGFSAQVEPAPNVQSVARMRDIFFMLINIQKFFLLG